MAKWFKKLFAESGDKTAIPDTTDPSGYVSYQSGYGADYERVLGTDPLAKAIERQKMNQVLNDITGAIQQYQTHGFPDYIDATTNGGIAYAYDIGAVVRFTDNKNYINTVAGNTNAPNVSGWSVYGDTSALAPLASPALTGTPTAPTATAGTNTTQIATTANVYASSIGWGQTRQDVTASRSLGTTYTNSTGKPIFVSIRFASISNGGTLTVGGVSMGSAASGTNASVTTSFIVLKGETYIHTGTAVIDKWIEIR